MAKFYEDSNQSGRKSIIEYDAAWVKTLISTAEQFTHLTNPNKDIIMTVYLTELHQGCTSAVTSGLGILLNSITYLRLDAREIDSIVAKFSDRTKDQGVGLRRLLTSVNPTFLAPIAIPVGVRCYPKEPIIAFSGNWATLNLLKPSIEEILPGLIRTASRCQFLKKMAGSSKLFLEAEPSMWDAEETAVASGHGGFDGGTHKSAVANHNLVEFEIDMDPADIQAIEKLGICPQFRIEVKTADMEVNWHLYRCGRVERTDQYYNELIKKYTENVKSKFIHISDWKDLCEIGTILLAMYRCKIVNLYGIQITSNYKDIARRARDIFGIISRNEPHFQSCLGLIMSYVTKEEELLEASQACSVVLMAEDVVTLTPVVPVIVQFSDAKGFLSHGHRVFRCTQKGKNTLDLVCYYTEEIEGGLPVDVYHPNGDFYESVDAEAWTPLMVEYDLNDPEKYSDENPNVVGSMLMSMTKDQPDTLPVFYTKMALV